MNNSSIKQTLLEAPDSQLDVRMKPIIEKLSDDPTPLQILEVLDKCIFSSLARALVVRVLQIIYEDECKRSNTTHEEVLKQATWRHNS